MKAFEIFFDSGPICEGSTLRDWVRYPSENVQAVIVLNDDDSREKITGTDYYSFINGREIIGQDLSLRQGYVKSGSLISTELYTAIIAGLESNSKLWNS